MSNMIRVKPTHDGTYTVYRGASVLISGLTKAQAERYGASLSAQVPAHRLTGSRTPPPSTTRAGLRRA